MRSELDFDHRLLLQFCGSAITSDAGRLPCRSAIGCHPARDDKNGRHRLAGLLRQSVFGRPGRLRGRERREKAVSRSGDALGGRRPARSPALPPPRPARWAALKQNGRADPRTLVRALADLPGQWIDKVHQQQDRLREKLTKIGAKVVSHGRYVTFQMAEVAVSWQMPGCGHHPRQREGAESG